MPKMTSASRSAELATLVFSLLYYACSSDNSGSGSPNVQNGGASGSGGKSGTGGNSSSGGKPAVGGSPSSAGAPSDGGSAGTPSDGGSAGTPSDGGSAGTPSDAGAGGEAGLGDGGSSGLGPVKVSLHFKATVGDKVFACGTTYAGQGTTKVSVEPRDFRFYVQDVRLLDKKGNAVRVTLDTRTPWQTPDVALLDFEDGTGACVDGNPEKNDVITGTVPSGTYSGVVFVNGIPDALNHGDPLQLPAPLQVGTMTWGWLYGFKFLKAELGAIGAPSGDAEPGLGLVHVGSTGCDNSQDGGMPDFGSPPKVACSAPNRNEVRLEGFDPATNTIVADIGALFAGVDLSENNQCHSEGPSCPTEFAALGVDFTTGVPKTTQSVYHVE